MSRKQKTCICGHNKRAHGYYYGCNKNRCGCQVFKRRKLVHTTSPVSVTEIRTALGISIASYNQTAKEINKEILNGKENK